MITPMILYITSAKASKKLNNTFPFSPIPMIPAPIISANAIICSMLPSTRAFNGLEGIIFNNVSITFGAAAISTVASTGMLKPPPTFVTFAKISPIVTAKAVVSM